MEIRTATCGMLGASVLRPTGGLGGRGVGLPPLRYQLPYSITPPLHHSITPLLRCDGPFLGPSSSRRLCQWLLTHSRPTPNPPLRFFSPDEDFARRLSRIAALAPSPTIMGEPTIGP